MSPLVHTLLGLIRQSVLGALVLGGVCVFGLLGPWQVDSVQAGAVGPLPSAWQALLGTGALRTPPARLQASPPAALPAPTLRSGARLGGAGTESLPALAVGADGRVWLAGSSTSPSFAGQVPGGAPGAGEQDVVIGVLSASGDRWEQLIRIGGSASEQAHGIALDGQGRAWVVGETDSADFPRQGSLHNPEPGSAPQPDSLPGPGAGGIDGFVLRLSARGEVEYSATLGRRGTDRLWSVAIGPGDTPGDAGSESIWVAGQTHSVDWVEPRPERGERGGSEVLLARLSASGALEQSYLLSGPGQEYARAVQVSPSGAVWIGGSSSSQRLSVPASAFAGSWQSQSGGGVDALIARLEPARGWTYLSYVGGAGTEQAQSLSLEPDGALWVTGSAQDSLGRSGRWQGWVLRLGAPGEPDEATGPSSWYRRYGGSGADRLRAVQADADGAWLVGWSLSKDLPVSAQAAQRSHNGQSDGWLLRLDQQGRMRYASYLGGVYRDELSALVVRPDPATSTPILWLAGRSASPELPPPDRIAPGALRPGTGTDWLVVQLDPGNRPPQIESQAPTRAQAGLPYQYQLQASDPDQDPLLYTLEQAPPGMRINARGLIQWSPEQVGLYPVQVVVSDGRGGRAEQRYQLSVVSANQPPQITSTAPVQAEIQALYRYPIQASDPEGQALDYELRQAPLGMRLVQGELRWTPARVGPSAVHLVVSDPQGGQDAQRFVIEVRYPADNQPPRWADLPDQEVALGSEWVLWLPVQDPEGLPLRFGVRPLPLPAGARLDVRSGQFRFRPRTAGSYTLIFSADDGRFRSEQRLLLKVPEPEPGAPTALRARLLDAESLARGQQRPLVGAQVSLLGTGLDTRTNAEGYFTISGIPPGPQTLDLAPGTIRAPNGALYAGFRERIELLEGVLNDLTRPLSLPRLSGASRTQINPQQRTIVENPELGVSLEVPAGMALDEAGRPYTGALWISEVPRGLAPAALPEFLDPGLLITIQPVGVRFAEPVPITFPNIDELEPGTEVDIWSLDPDSGDFGVVGKGRVSRDGQRIETIEGGIRAADWHGPVPAPPDPEPDCEPDMEPCNEPEAPENPGDCPGKSASTIDQSNCNLSVDFALPVYRSLERDRSWRFIYRSDTARPRPQVSFDVGLGAARPRRLSYRLRLGGRELEPVYVSMPRREGLVLRQGLAVPAEDLPSGRIPYELMITSIWAQTRIGTPVESFVLLDNAAPSPFGAGWRLQGLEELQVSPEGITRIRPGKRPMFYERNETGWTTPDADFSVLLALPGGGYRITEKDGTACEFDASGQMSVRRDRNGNELRYHYGAQRRLERLTDPVGLVTHFRYRNGYLHQVEDPAGRVSEFRHDAAGNLVQLTYPDGSVLRYGYDGAHLLQERRDERGNRYRYRYDSNGYALVGELPDGSSRGVRGRNLAGVHAPGSGTMAEPMEPLLRAAAQSLHRDARGHSSQLRLDGHSAVLFSQDAVARENNYERDADSNPTRLQRPNGSVLERQYDAQGNVLVRTERFNGATYRYTYDQYSLLTSYINPRGHRMQMDRDARGNMVTMVNHLGHTMKMEYDSRGLVTRSQSPNGLVTRYTYNAEGLRQESTETPPAGTPGAVRTTRWRYHPTGLMAGMTSPEGVETSFHYDERSRLIRMRDNLGQEQRFEYDLYGNIVRVEITNSDGSPALRTRQVYDERNRLIERAMPHVGESESITRYTLDAESNVTAMTDPNGAQSSSVYDRVDRLSSYTHRLNGVTEYEYDTRDRMIRVVAPNGVVTEYDYDVLARVTEERSPDRGTLRYEYDLANNVIAIREGRGIVMRYRYDELERMVEASYPNTHPGKDEQVRYRYDSCPLGLGRLCERHDESGRTAYRYDVWGNVVEMEHEELGVRYHTRYSWDREDKLSRMELPSGRVVEYSRDGVRRLLGLQARLNGERRPIVSELRYRGDNRMRSYRYGNGQQDQRSYDRQGRLLVQRLAGAEDLQSDARSYRYDANGNIVDLNGSYERNRYGYDALDRLDSDRIEEEAAIGYTYDLNGNRLRTQVEEDGTRYDYLSGSNRLQASEERRGPEAASFAPRADRRLEYNDAGRLWRLYEGEGADKPLRAEYIYNGMGQRTRKIVHEAEGRRRTTLYHYDLQGMLITETEADGSVLRDYLWANAQPVAQIDKQAEQERITYLYPDHLMTTRLGMDETGTVVWRWEGEAFGQSGAEQDPDGDGREVLMRLRFPGQYHDTESDLYYNWNRYYDPSTGRYIQSDFIGLQGGLNTYGYVEGNPLMYTDPTGEEPVLTAILLGVLIGLSIEFIIQWVNHEGNLLCFNIHHIIISMMVGSVAPGIYQILKTLWNAFKILLRLSKLGSLERSAKLKEYWKIILVMVVTRAVWDLVKFYSKRLTEFGNRDGCECSR